jgi:hypothetical protein
MLIPLPAVNGAAAGQWQEQARGRSNKREGPELFYYWCY